jgi:hypothetical protein
MEGPAAAEVYDTNRFSQLYHASRRPSPEHLGLAADFLFSLFDRHSILFAFLGGWAVYLRGGSRRTEDVDVSVDTDMDGLTAILMPEERCGNVLPCPIVSLYSFPIAIIDGSDGGSV